MDTIGKTPANYGPRVKNTPKASFIRITAKNRMQSAQPTDMDFSGSFNQTYLFDNDCDILRHNIDITEQFLNELGRPESRKGCNSHAKNTMIWRNVEFSCIKKFLKDYEFNNRLSVFNDIDSVIDWVDKITQAGKLQNWNVVVAGKVSDQNSVWQLPYGTINKVSRTRKRTQNEIDNIISLKDELGNNVNFEFLDLICYEGEKFIILLTETEEHIGEIAILRFESIDGDNLCFVSVEDKYIHDSVFKIFKEQWKEN